MLKKRRIKCDDSDSENDDEKVDSVHNNIYFYCNVTRKTAH